MAADLPNLEFVVVPAGQAAHRALAAAVEAAKGGDPLSPVTVVVANNFVGLSARRELATHSARLEPQGAQPGEPAPNGIAGVDFVTPFRLAELFGSASLAARGLKPVSTPVIAAAVRQVLNAEPGYFERVRDHPTTEKRLVNAHRELSELTDAELNSLAESGTRAAEVVRIHRGVSVQLATTWYSEQDLVGAAIEEIAQQPELAAALGPAIAFLPERLAASHSAMLRTLGSVTPLTAIFGTTGHPEADSSLLDAVGQLGGEQDATDARSAIADATMRLPTGTTSLSVSDADEEVRHVVRGLVAAAAEGVPYDRMAVVYASPNPYLRLLHDQLDAAAIPFNGQAVSTLAETPIGRLLISLLSLPDRDFRREDVIGLVSSAPVLWRGRVAPARAWDEVSRRAGVVRGLDQWSRQLETLSADLSDDIAAFGDDPEYEARVRHLERTVSEARQLKEFVAEVGRLVAQAAAAGSWAARSAWCHDVLSRFLDAIPEPDRVRRLASERVHLILARLGGLDTIEPEAPLAVFRRTLEAELESGLGRTGSFGTGVLVGPAAVASGLLLDRVWVVGMAEGLFPSRRRDDSLLPDRDRARVESLPKLADHQRQEHRHFLTSLAALEPDGTAVLTYPRGDLRQSNERAPSRWLLDVAGQLSGQKVHSADEFERLGTPLVRHVASFSSGLTGCANPPTNQEYDLRSLVEASRSGDLADHRLLSDGGRLAASATAQRERSSSRFTRFDGNLPHGLVRRPGTTESITSATALETWAKCPHQYFVRYLLGVDPLETPERRLRMDPLSRGTLLHRTLERFVAEQVGRNGGAPFATDPSSIELQADRLHDIAREEFDHAHARGLTGEPIYWHRDQTLLRRELGHYLTVRNARDLALEAKPLHAELAFGLRGGEPVPIRLPGGDTVLLRGSIDLVEQLGDGSLAILDYKTGARTKIDEAEPHAGGTRLQLALYALAARRVLDQPDVSVYSGYWYLRPSIPKAIEGYDVTNEISDRVLGAVQTIVDSIEAGIFPNNPDMTTRLRWIPCQYCDPDGLGVGEAHRRLARMAADPDLSAFLELARPELAAAHDQDLPRGAAQ